MRKQLPEYVYTLLNFIGKIGDKINCPVVVVGGFVRDLLIGRTNLDIDIVIEGDGIAFAHALAESKICSPLKRMLPLEKDAPPCKGGWGDFGTEGILGLGGFYGKVKRHQRFGTAVVTLADGFKVDVATARTEVYGHPGALPSVKPGSIKEDLRRRDFTINAMAIELNEERFGSLVDFFGGESDLHDRWIRVLHDLSFVDDPTRIFRAVRFEQRYGFHIESHTEKLLRKAVTEGYLGRITRQRLRNEILLILKEENPVPAIQQMAHFDLTKYIHPRICVDYELANLIEETGKVLVWWTATASTHGEQLSLHPYPHSAHSKIDPVLLNLMSLLDQLNIAEVEDVSERLALRRQYIEALKLSKTRIPGIFRCLGEAEKSASEIYGILKGIPLEVLLFAMAKLPAEARSPLRDGILCYLVQLRKVRPLVNGDDLRELGYPEGPLYAQILDRTFAAQLDGLIGDRQQAIQFIKNHYTDYCSLVNE